MFSPLKQQTFYICIRDKNLPEPIGLFLLNARIDLGTRVSYNTRVHPSYTCIAQVIALGRKALTMGGRFPCLLLLNPAIPLL